MFDVPDCADKCLRRPWRFAIVGSDELRTKLSTYLSCISYHYLTAFYIDMEILTSDCMLLPIIAASSVTYHFEMCVLGVISGGRNCRVVVHQLLSALLLFLGPVRIQQSPRRLAPFGFNQTGLRCLWSHDSLLWKR